MPNVVATNTLIFTDLPDAVFASQGRELRDLLQSYGHLVRMVLLKSFGRVLCVFDDTLVAMQIKQEWHKKHWIQTNLRVYYGMQTDLQILDPAAGPRGFLQVPEPERNFLLSPPGSPAIGWVQTREAEPVAGGFSEDLMEHAFSYVSLADFTLDGGTVISMDASVKGHKQEEGNDLNAWHESHESRESRESAESRSGQASKDATEKQSRIGPLISFNESLPCIQVEYATDEEPDRVPMQMPKTQMPTLNSR